MRSFVSNCRRMAAVTGMVVLGATAASLGTGPAHAQADPFIEKSFPDKNQTSTSRKMRLGAYRAEQSRESLSGGSRKITRAKTSRKARSAKKRRGVRLASLGNSFTPDTSPGSSLAGRGVKWTASSGCLNSTLRAIIHQVASTFGHVTVNSTCRSRRHNARVGGAHRSHHLTGNAVDFRVRGNTRAVYAFLRSHGSVGGLKLYRRGFFHIDTGSRRTW